MKSTSPHGIPRGIPHDEAVRRGICGAQRKNEEAPCEGPRNEKGRSICGRHCGSKNRQGYPCGNHRKGANGRCGRHGADSPVGAESGTWVDGRSSKYGAIFTGDALEHYEKSREDPRYVELKEEIHLFDTLILQELMAAKVGEGAALWQELGDQWRRFQEAEPTKDATSAGRALRRMGELISEGVGRHAAQAAAVELVERKRKLSETERRRIHEEEQTITQARAIAFAGAMVGLMRESVAGEENEREILARFHAGVARLVHQDVSGGAGVLTPS